MPCVGEEVGAQGRRREVNKYINHMASSSSSSDAHLLKRIEELQLQVQTLNAQLQVKEKDKKNPRKKIDVMSSEVVDSNPYR